MILFPHELNGSGGDRVPEGSSSLGGVAVVQRVEPMENHAQRQSGSKILGRLGFHEVVRIQV
jgi:hypothetical protein